MKVKLTGRALKNWNFRVHLWPTTVLKARASRPSGGTDLVAYVNLAELLEEAEHGELQLLAAALRESGVGKVHELQHTAYELPVHRVVLVIAVERDAAADGRPDDVHQPRQPTCTTRSMVTYSSVNQLPLYKRTRNDFWHSILLENVNRAKWMGRA